MQLTEKVLCYQLGNWTWSNLWADLQRHIDDFLAYYSLCPDTQARFMNQFEPRLLGMVERFEYRGITFDALLRRSLHLQLRSIFRQMKKERLLFSLSVNNAQTLAEQDPENCYAPSIPDQGCQRPAKGAARSIRQFSTLKVAERRCVVAALKNCLHMTDQLCLDLAQALRLSPQ